eukprot:jgi/Mesvir1/15598/Mv03208-RA.1
MDYDVREISGPPTKKLMACPQENGSLPMDALGPTREEASIKVAARGDNPETRHLLEEPLSPGEIPSPAYFANPQSRAPLPPAHPGHPSGLMANGHHPSPLRGDPHDAGEPGIRSGPASQALSDAKHAHDSKYSHDPKYSHDSKYSHNGRGPELNKSLSTLSTSGVVTRYQVTFDEAHGGGHPGHLGQPPPAGAPRPNVDFIDDSAPRPVGGRFDTVVGDGGPHGGGGRPQRQRGSAVDAKGMASVRGQTAPGSSLRSSLELGINMLKGVQSVAAAAAPVVPYPVGFPAEPEFLRVRSFTGGNAAAAAAAARRRSSAGRNTGILGRRRSLLPGADPVDEKENLFDSKRRRQHPWLEKISRAIDHPSTTVFMLVITIWALVGEDIRLAATYKGADGVFVGLVIMCLVLFSLELILASISKPDYFLGFYFWLDLIATLSLLLDLPVVMHLFIQESESDEGANSATLARAGRTSRAGTRAGRILRLIRLVRVFKMYHNLKRTQDEVQRAKMDPELYALQQEHLGKMGKPGGVQQSRVGQKLSDLTTRRVIIGVLLMLFMVPIFDANFYLIPDTFTLRGLEMVHESYMGSSRSGLDYWDFIQSNDSSIYRTTLETYVETIHPLTMSINGTILFKRERLDHLRPGEMLLSIFDTSESVSDKRWESQMQAILNICRTVFVCIILGMGALLFSRDANELVIMPIERMIKKVRDVSENPLMKQKVLHEEEKTGKRKKSDNQFETMILENSIIKICSLLAIGFGDAGAEIIGENMKNGGDLNPMVAGHKMVAIFGFCDIRNFTDVTEVLQEQVMEFVNSIARIVHMEVSLHSGSANKNIGDAFLLVWKFPKFISMGSLENPTKPQREAIQRIADQALASFIVVMAALKKSARLAQFAKNEGIRKRFFTDHYEVSMGFGLHVGWAIEGAIGSEYKIDASYLSPNVNIAARLEAATKQFGVPILLSSDFAAILSPGVRARCREIDRVTVKGSLRPMGLWTYDVNLANISPPKLDEGEDPMSPVFPQDSASFREFNDEFVEHPDIVAMSDSPPEFLATFRQGFTAYTEGHWDVASELLATARTMRRTRTGDVIPDGPSTTLLGVMRAHGNISPPDWKGFRELTEK